MFDRILVHASIYTLVLKENPSEEWEILQKFIQVISRKCPLCAGHRLLHEHSVHELKLAIVRLV